jgi:hypothetical protein
MDRRVTGDPERLEAFTHDMLPLVDRAREAVEAYSQALAAFNGAQPNDLGTHIGDLSPLLDGNLDLLEEIDRAPEAFAFGLRRLDDNPHPVRVSEERWFDALVSVRLSDGDATLDDAVSALDTSWQWPWENGVGDWLRGSGSSPGFWAGTPIGAALSTVAQIDERLVVEVSAHTRAGSNVRGYHRWKGGWADRMNRLSSASRVATVGGPAKWTGRFLPVVGAGALQIHQDWGDESLSTGDRIARTGAAAAVEGGAGALGAAGGAALGTLVAPGVGTVAGGVIGGIAGGEVGSHLLDNMQGRVDRAGERLDQFGEQLSDRVTGAVEFGSDALDTMADVGGSAVATVGGWFDG